MKFTLAFSILVLLVITGCGSTKIVEYRSPIVEVGEIETESVDFDGILLTANVQLTNDQAFEFNVIGSVYYDIELPNFRGGDATPFQVSQFQKFDRLGN